MNAQIQARADTLEKALIETSHETLGKRQKHKQPHWVTSTSLALIEAQNQAKRLHKAKPTTSSKKLWVQLQKDATEALGKDEENYFESKLADL